MRVLTAVRDLYASIGGGQTLTRNLISQNADIDFFFFGERHPSAPANAHALPLRDHYRTIEGGLGVNQIFTPRAALALAEKDADIALLLDMATAAAASGHDFDIVDIPDFEPFAGLLPEFLRLCGVRVGKTLLSMHGTLTLSIRDLWQGANANDLTVLEAYEDLTYRAADLRYGISDAYAAARASVHGRSGMTIDPLLAVDLRRVSWGDDYAPPAFGVPGAVRRPDLNFVGRQDYIKGPDLFLYIAGNLPRDRFGDINLYGSGVEIDGVGSTRVLNQIASRRGIEINRNQPLSASELRDLFASGRGITFVTSRVDTFNLVALESLLNGCPTIISRACGICRYLEERWPTLPYVRLDPDNIWAALPQIMDVIENYDDHRARLAAALKQGPRPVGRQLQAVLSAAVDPDMSARHELAAVAEAIFRNLAARIAPKYLTRTRGEVVETARMAAAEHGTTDLSAYMSHLLDGITEVLDIAARSALGPVESMTLDHAMEALTGVIEHRRVARMLALDLLALTEKARGNELLYAVYQVRRFRIARWADPSILERVREILTNHNFAAEAAALDLLYRDGEDATYRYLVAQREACSAPDGEGIESVEHFNRRPQPRVAVLVSVYNAADKIHQFCQGLRSFVPEVRRSLEVVFVDSGSGDGSADALRRELGRETFDEHPLDATIMRTTRRETIQAAWNRALTIVRAPYVTFLGVDEMMRPDALAVLADELDRDPRLGWVQGSAVVCQVNEHGTPIRDETSYDRTLDHRFMHYLDCCYMGWVGGLYRRQVHDVAGYYNPTFRAAGDNEFKNRALPLMPVRTLPESLGTFLNFPGTRTTQSPVAEIEDIRAWYLPRSPGGMRYAFEGEPRAAIALFYRCLGYRKTYMAQTCTDLELALSVASFLERHHPALFYEVQDCLPAVHKAANAYRLLDDIIMVNSSSPILMIAMLGERMKSAMRFLAEAEKELSRSVPAVTLALYNDNRFHQHQNVWASRASRCRVGDMLDLGDIAGPQDLAELVSSCQSDDPSVDFETAWSRGDFGEIRRLFAESRIDLVLPVPSDVTAGQVSEALQLFDVVTRDASLSLLVAGVVPRSSAWIGRRIYVTGRVRTLRPVLAAARLAVLPFWSEDLVAAALPLAIELLCLGKPVLLSRPLAVRLAGTLPCLAAAAGGLLLVCEHPADMARQGKELVTGPIEQRIEMARRARGLAIAIRASASDVVDAPPGATVLPAEGDWLLEWDEEFDAINRIYHSFIERDVDLQPRRRRLDEVLARPTARAKLAAITERLLVTKDAHALRTAQSFFQVLLHQPRASGVQDGLARLYVASMTRSPRLEIAPYESAQPWDLVIPGIDAPWFLDAWRWFRSEVLDGVLGGRALRIAASGLPSNEAGVTVIAPGMDERPFLDGARVLVCLGTEQAALRPSSFDLFAPLFGLGRPIAGMPGALWFAGAIARGDASSLAADLMGLLGDASSRNDRIAAVAELSLVPKARAVGADTDEAAGNRQAEQDTYGEEAAALSYWNRYPDIAADATFGVRGVMGIAGAAMHYREHGRREGRTWG